jgi:uncharacterized LabA/DUF88 family protein
MADSSRERVAVYLDFDNIVISRYDHVFGPGQWRKDEARSHRADATSQDPIDNRLAEAEIDIGAVLDYASSFGTVALARAYADWSVTANAAYRKQLVNRAVDLTQLFATTGGLKNGADIRLSVDAIEDLFQLDDLTHVVIVAGDSDYIALAQRCKRLGRFVVGIGVTGSTSPALVAACDEFSDYGDLPGVTRPEPRSRPARSRGKAKAKAEPDQEAGTETADPESGPEGDTGNGTGDTPAKKTTRRTRKSTAKKAPAAEPSPQDEATHLLVRAVLNAQSKNDDEWLFSSGLKSQMQRMDPGFKEKALGFKTFADFVDSRSDVVETKSDSDNRQQLRLRPPAR